MFRRVPLKEIVRCLELYPRMQHELEKAAKAEQEGKEYKKRRVTDWRIVLKYKEALQCGAKFPPITLVRRKRDGKLILVDGYHRCDAHEEARCKAIDANILTKPMTDGEIFALAVKMNITHGRSLSVQERIAAGQHLLREFRFSAALLQRTLQITARSFKRLLDERIVDSEVVGPLSIRFTKKAPLAHQKLSAETAENLPDIQDSMAAHDQRQIFQEAHTLLENDLIETRDKKLLTLIFAVGALIQQLKGGLGGKKKKHAA